MMSQRTYKIRRCHTCGLDYAPHDEFSICARCEDRTERLDVEAHYPADRAPTRAESAAAVLRIKAELARADQADIEAVIERAEARGRQLARTISAAGAALRYDLDVAWAEADLSDPDGWVAGG